MTLLLMLACSTPTDRYDGTQIGGEGDEFPCTTTFSTIDDDVAAPLDFPASEVVEASTIDIEGVHQHVDRGPIALSLSFEPDGPVVLETRKSEDRNPVCDIAQYVQPVRGVFRLTDGDTLVHEVDFTGFTFAGRSGFLGVRSLPAPGYGEDPSPADIAFQAFLVDGVWNGDSWFDTSPISPLGAWTESEPPS